MSLVQQKDFALAMNEVNTAFASMNEALKEAECRLASLEADVEECRELHNPPPAKRKTKKPLDK